MARRPHRLAIAYLQTWDVAVRVKSALSAADLSENSIVMLALLDSFATRSSTVPGELVELPLLQAGGKVCCMVGPLAAKLGQTQDLLSVEQLLDRWLLPRPARRIASHIEKGSVAIGVQFTNSEDEQTGCRILLASTALALEVHDVDCGDCRESH